jgi:hypothetical protein
MARKVWSPHSINERLDELQAAIDSIQRTGVVSGAPTWSDILGKPSVFTPDLHAYQHVTGGTDKIRDATAALDGLMTAAFASKLDGIAAGANLYVHPNHSGHVVSAADGATTIQPSVVSLAMLANVTGPVIIGRYDAGAGSVQLISVGNGLEFSGTGIRRAAITGDVSVAAGDATATIAANAVSNTKLADMPANTFKGNNTGSSADPKDLTVAEMQAALGIGTTGMPPTVVDAASMIPAVTNGAGVNTRSVGGVRVIDSVDFDTATQETVTFDVATPVGWAGSTFTAYFQWSTASGTAAQFVRWEIAAVMEADGDAESVAFGTAQVVDDAIGTVDTIRISAATPAVTPAGTPTGGRIMSCRVRRVPASDDAPDDARLQKVFFTFA